MFRPCRLALAAVAAVSLTSLAIAAPPPTPDDKDGWTQINATHTDKIKTGSIYPNGNFGLDKYPKEQMCVMNTAAHGPDEWVVYEVIAKGPTLTTIVNGKKQIEWTDPEHRFKKGHIAL